MFGARTNCYGCHADWTDAAESDRVLKGTQRTCVACHGERHAKTFDQWKAGIELTVADAEEIHKNARQALAEATKLLDIAATDLHLVKHGNGIHNVTYALELLDSVTAHCQKAVTALTE